MASAEVGRVVASTDTVKVIDRWGTGCKLEISVSGRHLRLVYDPRETGPFLFIEAAEWVEAPGKRIDRADLDRVIELLGTHRIESAPVLERVEPEGCFVARCWGRGSDEWLARIVCANHPWPGRSGYGDVECLALGRTANVPFVAPDASGALIAELQWAAARWVYPARAELTPDERTQLSAWLAQAKPNDFFLTSPGWSLRDA